MAVVAITVATLSVLTRSHGAAVQAGGSHGRRPARPCSPNTPTGGPSPLAGGKKVCFALAKPKCSHINPADRKRDPAYIFISIRPAENVKNEVSVIIGYPFKANSDARRGRGRRTGCTRRMHGALIKNVADETRMIDAMRKGSELTVKGTSGRGIQSTDQYSPKGLGEAISRVEQECK